MKVAITGGTGFLGKYVSDRLIKEKYIPVILTRSSDNNSQNDNLEFRKTNYSKADLIDKLVDIDAVVHLAAMRGSQGMISEFHSNEILTQNLYEACSERNITNIVYASTISVYSNLENLPWTEMELPAPKLMYGVSKLSCEYLGNIYSEKKGLYIKNLRFTHLFGFNEKNNYMINRFFRQAFHKEKLIINTKSVAKREFLYGKDAAKAVICGLRQGNIKGTFNIGSGETFTNFEVAFNINRIFENDGNLSIKNPNTEENIKSSYMDSGKANKIIHFTPDFTFSSALSEIYTLMEELDDVPLLY